MKNNFSFSFNWRGGEFFPFWPKYDVPGVGHYILTQKKVLRSNSQPLPGLTSICTQKDTELQSNNFKVFFRHHLQSAGINIVSNNENPQLEWQETLAWTFCQTSRRFSINQANTIRACKDFYKFTICKAFHQWERYLIVKSAIWSRIWPLYYPNVAAKEQTIHMGHSIFYLHPPPPPLYWKHNLL